MRTKARDIAFKVKSADAEKGEFTAYASVFGNVDSYGEVVEKGAFADTLKEWKDSGNPIPLLWGHNMSDPDYNVGAITEAKEDENGLLVKAQIDMDSPKAAQVFRLIKSGRVGQMSFAFDVLEGAEGKLDSSDGEKDAGGGQSVYFLKKLKLYEVSVVPIGANQATEILSVKSALSALDVEGKPASHLLAVRGILEETLQKINDMLPGVDPLNDRRDPKNNVSTTADSDSKSASALDLESDPLVQQFKLYTNEG